ncbi:MAG: TRAP transporter large permease subunit [Candidatus Acidiferrum sp.]
MTGDMPLAADFQEKTSRNSRGWIAALLYAENSLVALSLAIMIALPLAEAVLRRTLHISIPGSISIVQHMVLILGMLGGSIAAREQRLLALSNLSESRIRGRAKSFLGVFTGAVSVVIVFFLGVAAWQFVQMEREAAKILAFGIPVWMVETVLPIGFVFIAIRILWHISDGWPGRVAGLFLALLFAAVGGGWFLSGHNFAAAALALLFLASVLGVPALVTLGGAALILFHGADQPIASIPIAHYALVTNPTLPTLPLFTLAGYFLAEGGSPRRLVRLFYALFGQFRGGAAIVTVLVCAFFTSFTGASGVTILALGGLLMPVLKGARYSDKDALGLMTGAGSLGLLLPPCLPLIVYAIVAKVPIETMFLGGIFPAFVMMIATAIWGVRRGPKSPAAKPSFDAVEVRRSLWEAKWELFMPGLAFIALFSGLATPVEGAAITAFYAFFIAVIVHRELKIPELPRVMSECGLLIGGILLILGVSLGFTNYLVDVEIPARAVAWTTHTIHSPILFLLLLNLFLLIVGCLMEIYPAIVIEVPLLVPLGAAFGIDPVRLGIIFLANMELGYLTPPVGLNLLMSSYRFRKPVPEVLRAVLPVIVVLSIGVLVITFIPALTTALPRLFNR